MLGDGLGGFTSNGNFSVGRSPFSVATGDFNSDGKADVIVANGSSFFTARLPSFWETARVVSAHRQIFDGGHR